MKLFTFSADREQVNILFAAHASRTLLKNLSVDGFLAEHSLLSSEKIPLKELSKISKIQNLSAIVDNFQRTR